MRTRLFLSFFFASSVVVAQTPTHISPRFAAVTSGNSGNSLPFAAAPNGYQQVHSRTSFNNTTPAVFTRMRLKMAAGSENSPGLTIDVELFMARSPNDALSASNVFANNVIGTEVNVFTRKMVLLPQVPPGWLVGPFPFDAPFPYVGSHLSWRANVYGNSAGNQNFPYYLDAWRANPSNGYPPVSG